MEWTKMQMKYKNVDEVVKWVREVSDPRILTKKEYSIYIHESVRQEIYVSDMQLKNKLFDKCTFEDLKGGVWKLTYFNPVKE